MIQELDILSSLVKAQGFKGTIVWAKEMSKKGILSNKEASRLIKLVNIRNSISHDGVSYSFNDEEVSFVKKMQNRVNDYSNGAIINSNNQLYQHSYLDSKVVSYKQYRILIGITGVGVERVPNEDRGLLEKIFGLGFERVKKVKVEIKLLKGHNLDLYYGSELISLTNDYTYNMELKHGEHEFYFPQEEEVWSEVVGGYYKPYSYYIRVTVNDKNQLDCKVIKYC